jgi:hypothetical protein
MIDIVVIQIGIIILVFSTVLTIYNNEVADKKIYISMTTIPERLKTSYFKKVVENLLGQHTSLNILLNIPHTYKRTGEVYVVPEWITNHSRIVVNRCEDYGPATKILGGLDILKNFDTVIIVDDDLMYRHFFVKELLTTHIESPKDVTCYNTWHEPAWQRQGHKYPLPGGYSGCIGSASIFKQLKSIPQCNGCFPIDDHWLGYAYNQLRVTLRQVKPGIPWDFSINRHDTHPIWHELCNSTNRSRQQALCLNELTSNKLNK